MDVHAAIGRNTTLDGARSPKSVKGITYDTLCRSRAAHDSECGARTTGGRRGAIHRYRTDAVLRACRSSDRGLARIASSDGVRDPAPMALKSCVSHTVGGRVSAGVPSTTRLDAEEQQRSNAPSPGPGSFRPRRPPEARAPRRPRQTSWKARQPRAPRCVGPSTSSMREGAEPLVPRLRLEEASQGRFTSADHGSSSVCRPPRRVPTVAGGRLSRPAAPGVTPSRRGGSAP